MKYWNKQSLFKKQQKLIQDSQKNSHFIPNTNKNLKPANSWLN